MVWNPTGVSATKQEIQQPYCSLDRQQNGNGRMKEETTGKSRAVIAASVPALDKEMVPKYGLHGGVRGAGGGRL